MTITSVQIAPVEQPEQPDLSDPKVLQERREHAENAALEEETRRKLRRMRAKFSSGD